MTNNFDPNNLEHRFRAAFFCGRLANERTGQLLASDVKAIYQWFVENTATELIPKRRDFDDANHASSSKEKEQESVDPTLLRCPTAFCGGTMELVFRDEKFWAVICRECGHQRRIYKKG